jgi:transposase
MEVRRKEGCLQQLRARRRKEVLCLGIDISKKRADVCLKSGATIVDRFSVNNDKDGVAMLLQKLDPYVKQGSALKGAIESTGNMWLRVYETLEQK